MSNRHFWVLGALSVSSLVVVACGRVPPGPAQAEAPSHVEHIDGTDLSRVALTDKAI